MASDIPSLCCICYMVKEDILIRHLLKVILMKFRFNQFVCTTICALPFLFSSYSQAQTLSEALSGLLNDNATVESAAQSVLSAKSGADSARTRLYPKVTVASSVTRKKLDNATVRGLGFNDGKTKTVHKKSLKVSQGLFNGFSDMARIEEADSAHKRAQAKLVATEQSEMSRGAVAYYAVLQETALIESLERAYGFSQQMLELARENRKNGGHSDAKWITAQKDTLDQKSKLIRQKNRLSKAIGDYVRYFGAEPNPKTMAFTKISDAQMPVSQEDLLGQIRDSAEVLASFMKAEMSQARIKREKAAAYPSLSLDLKHERDDDSFTGNAAGGVGLSDTEETSLELALKWELSALLYNRHVIDRANSNSLSDRAKAHALLKRLEGQAVQLWENYQQHLDEVALMDEIRQHENRLEEIEAEKRAAGGGKLLDQLKMQLKHERTVQQSIRTKHGLEQTKVRILALINQLSADV